MGHYDDCYEFDARQEALRKMGLLEKKRAEGKPVRHEENQLEKTIRRVARIEKILGLGPISDFKTDEELSAEIEQLRRRANP